MVQVIQRLKRSAAPSPDQQELEDNYAHITTNAVMLLRSFSLYFIIHCDPATLQIHFTSKTGKMFHLRLVTCTKSTHIDQNTTILAGPLLESITHFIVTIDPISYV